MGRRLGVEDACQYQNEEDFLTWTQRLDAAKEAVREVIGKVWKWVTLSLNEFLFQTNLELVTQTRSSL